MSAWLEGYDPISGPETEDATKANRAAPKFPPPCLIWTPTEGFETEVYQYRKPAHARAREKSKLNPTVQFFVMEPTVGYYCPPVPEVIETTYD